MQAMKFFGLSFLAAFSISSLSTMVGCLFNATKNFLIGNK